MINKRKVTKTAKRFKSLKLKPFELKKLKELVAEYPNKEEAAKAIGLGNRMTLSRIIAIGSGSSESIEIIRKKISKAA